MAIRFIAVVAFRPRLGPWLSPAVAFLGAHIPLDALGPFFPPVQCGVAVCARLRSLVRRLVADMLCLSRRAVCVKMQQPGVAAPLCRRLVRLLVVRQLCAVAAWKVYLVEHHRGDKPYLRFFDVLNGRGRPFKRAVPGFARPLRFYHPSLLWPTLVASPAAGLKLIGPNELHNGTVHKSET